MLQKRRIIVGITGASGVVMGYHLLNALRRQETVGTHLIITRNAKLTIDCETQITWEAFVQLADEVHDELDFTASIASGSYVTDGMIVIPCSMKSLAGIVWGYTDNLVLRAADVCLKEGRKVVLVPREAPLGKVHLRNLVQAADLGCSIIPPMLTFYNSSDSLQEQIDHIIGKILMQFGLCHETFRAWEGRDHVVS